MNDVISQYRQIRLTAHLDERGEVEYWMLALLQVHKGVPHWHLVDDGRLPLPFPVSGPRDAADLVGAIACALAAAQ
uniref:Uncharacterized protein n=1 Tax=uncultured prokaryote TaxID=198431 RepID=A0A0H5Q7S7_9ZZZZ|nr:hypothetical protein [uncultured prokaryote]